MSDDRSTQQGSEEQLERDEPETARPPQPPPPGNVLQVKPPEPSSPA